MEMQFSSQTLAEIFRDLFHQERSGMLQLSRGDVEKRIYFDRGMILFAESDLEDEDLGPRLVSEGKISPGALAEARRNISEPKDLAQALVNRDLIAKDALADTVRYIVDRVVRSVFQWEGGTARFSEGWLLQELFDADVVTTFEVLLKGMSSMVGFEPLGAALKDLDAALRVRKASPVPVDLLALTPAHGFVLSRLEGGHTTFRDVLSILPAAEEDLAARFLYGLLVMGVLEFEPSPSEGPFRVSSILRDHADQAVREREQEQAITEAYESFRNKPPWEVLGVDPAASREAVERAYASVKAAFSRERMSPRIVERFRAELGFIESRLVESYLSLLESRRSQDRPQAQEVEPEREEDLTADDLLVRVEMDKTRTKKALEANSRIADEYYQRARRAVREGDFHNAVQYAKLAITYSPEDARLYALLGECQARNPESRWQRQAEQNLAKAAELDPWNAETWIRLGRFYKERGLKLRARKHFEQALQVAPGSEEAITELDALAS